MKRRRMSNPKVAVSAVALVLGGGFAREARGQSATQAPVALAEIESFTLEPGCSSEFCAATLVAGGETVTVPRNLLIDLPANRLTAKQIFADTTEIWHLKNGGGGWSHPVHIHNIQFLVLDRNGGPIEAGDVGLKDTFRLGPNEEVRVIGNFADNIGRYAFHCHNLEHEDMRMMGRFDVVP